MASQVDKKVLNEVFHNLDRSFFLDVPCKDLASFDEPLPIGYGQTISQPTLVVALTALLDPEPHSRVLVFGTG